MNEVSCRSLKALVEMAEHSGLNRRELLAGVQRTEEELFNPKGRVEWTLYVQTLRRCLVALGGFEAVRKMGEYYHETTAHRYVGPIARSFVHPRAFYWFVNRWLGPMSFSNQTATTEDLPHDRLRITLRIHAGQEDSPEYFWLSAGALTVLPRYIGLRDAIIDLQVSPMMAVFTITLPPAGTVLSRLRWMFKALFAPRGAIEELRGQHDQICAQYETTDRMRREYQELLERNPNGIVVHWEGRMLYANPAMSRALGYQSPAELMTLALQDLVFPADLPAWRRLLTPDGTPGQHEEVRFVGRDDQIVIMELTQIVPVRFGQRDAAMILAHDVTEQRELEHTIEQTRNQEQERLARDLHDGLGQQLVALVRHTEALKSSATTAALDDVIALAVQAASDAQEIGRGLDPLALTSAGLPGILSDLAQRTANHFNIQCTCHSQGVEARVAEKSTASHLYRIAQEALNNAVRHGHATDIVISLQQTGDALSLCVTDNGTGMDGNSSNRVGAGLRNMHYRAKQIGAELDVRPCPTGGTEVACVVPPEHHLTRPLRTRGVLQA